MNPSISQEISLLRELLGQQQEVGIVIGTHQNLDTYAAALALFASLRASGKKVQIISKKAPTVEVSNLVGIDKVRESFATGGGNNSKLVISLPYIKGEVEKVLFTEYPNPENPTNINFHLTAAPGKSISQFDLSDVKLMWDGAGTSPALIITVGVGSVDELSGVADQNSAKVVNIDNFSGNTQFGDVVLVDPSFSSLSEISGKIVKDLNLPLDTDTAQNLLDGVLFATRNFTKQNTSPFAFETASSAMYAGARRNEDRAQQPRDLSSNPHQGQRPQNQQDNRTRDRGQQNRGGQREPRQRVGENDFPAMHMQQRQQSQDRRFNEPQRGGQGQGFRHDRPQRPQQNFGQTPQGGGQFGQNPNDIDELMRKINEENAKRQQSQQFDQNRQRTSFPQENVEQNSDEPMQDKFSAQDAQVIDEPKRNEDMNMPEDNYTPPDPSEVPDDWLMPKVFKSSKNNN